MIYNFELNGNNLQSAQKYKQIYFASDMYLIESADYG